MSISYTPFVFIGGGSGGDIQLTLSDSTALADYAFRWSGTAYGQVSKSVRVLKSKTLTTAGQYALYGMDVLEELELPNLTSIGNYGLMVSTASAGATAPLTVLELPKIQTVGTYAFRYRQMLRTVTLGSAGNPVSSIGTNAFGNCTQSGLTITIYTSGGAELDGSPWGATNATIHYETA